MHAIRSQRPTPPTKHPTAHSRCVARRSTAVSGGMRSSDATKSAPTSRRAARAPSSALASLQSGEGGAAGCLLLHPAAEGSKAAICLLAALLRQPPAQVEHAPAKHT